MTPAPATPPPRPLPALPSIGKVHPNLARIIVALANADADRDYAARLAHEGRDG